MGMAGGGMGSVTPLLATGGSPTCHPATAAMDTAGVFQHQEDGPAACQLDTRGAPLTLPVAAVPRDRLLLLLRAVAVGLLW